MPDRDYKLNIQTSADTKGAKAAQQSLEQVSESAADVAQSSEQGTQNLAQLETELRDVSRVGDDARDSFRNILEQLSSGDLEGAAEGISDLRDNLGDLTDAGIDISGLEANLDVLQDMLIGVSRDGSIAADSVAGLGKQSGSISGLKNQVADLATQMLGVGGATGEVIGSVVSSIGPWGALASAIGAVVFKVNQHITAIEKQIEADASLRRAQKQTLDDNLQGLERERELRTAIRDRLENYRTSLQRAREDHGLLIASLNQEADAIERRGRAEISRIERLAQLQNAAIDLQGGTDGVASLEQRQAVARDRLNSRQAVEAATLQASIDNLQRQLEAEDARRAVIEETQQRVGSGQSAVDAAEAQAETAGVLESDAEATFAAAFEKFLPTLSKDSRFRDIESLQGTDTQSASLQRAEFVQENRKAISEALRGGFSDFIQGRDGEALFNSLNIASAGLVSANQGATAAQLNQESLQGKADANGALDADKSTTESRIRSLEEELKVFSEELEQNLEAAAVESGLQQKQQFEDLGSVSRESFSQQEEVFLSLIEQAKEETRSLADPAKRQRAQEEIEAISAAAQQALSDRQITVAELSNLQTQFAVFSSGLSNSIQGLGRQFGESLQELNNLTQNQLRFDGELGVIRQQITQLSQSQSQSAFESETNAEILRHNEIRRR